MIKNLFQSEFIKNIFTLVKGSVLAQGIAILISPILTRLYTPDDFGVFALYASIVGILVVIATGRYEIAIVLPEKDEDAKGLVNLSFLLSLIFSVFVFVIVFFFGQEIAKSLNNESIEKYLFLVPISIFIYSAFNIFNFALTRLKSYKALSISRVALSSTNSGFSVIAGISKLGGLGLILGQLLGFLLASIYLGFKNQKDFSKIEATPISKVLKEYKEFPIKSGLSGLLNILSNQLPILLIGIYYGPVVLGVYALTLKVLGLPLTMIGKSVSQVFFQTASSYQNENKSLFSFVKDTSFKLGVFITLPMIIILFFGESLFGFVFGQEWTEAGELAKYFAAFYIVRFVFYSQSTLYSVRRKLGIELRQNTVLLIVQVGALFVGNHYFDNYMDTFKLMAFSGFVVYCLFLVSLFKIAKD